MGLILDSSVLISAEREGKNARQVLAALSKEISEEDVAISVVTLIELPHGAMRQTLRSANGSGRNFSRSCCLRWLSTRSL